MPPSDMKLEGKRVLVTQADQFMGPTLCEVFSEHGAVVIADTGSLLEPARPAALVASVGRIDVLDCQPRRAGTEYTGVRRD